MAYFFSFTFLLLYSALSTKISFLLTFLLTFWMLVVSLYYFYLFWTKIMFHNIYLLDTLVLKLYDKDRMGENLELLTDVLQSIVYIYIRLAQQHFWLICFMYIVIRYDTIASIFNKIFTCCFNLELLELVLLGYANITTEEPDFCCQHRSVHFLIKIKHYIF